MIGNQEEYLKRVSICEKCTHIKNTYFFKQIIKRCNQCGCLIAMRVRGNCPIGKF